MAVGDTRGNGIQDLLVSYPNISFVDYGNGDGTFEGDTFPLAKSVYSSPPGSLNGCVTVQAADLQGNHTTDVITTDFNLGTARSLSTLLFVSLLHLRRNLFLPDESRKFPHRHRRPQWRWRVGRGHFELQNRRSYSNSFVQTLGDSAQTQQSTPSPPAHPSAGAATQFSPARERWDRKCSIAERRRRGTSQPVKFPAHHPSTAPTSPPSPQSTLHSTAAPNPSTLRSFSFVAFGRTHAKACISRSSLLPVFMP